MKAEKHLFDISTKDKRRETTSCMAEILQEIYWIEDENLQELIYEYDESCCGYDKLLSDVSGEIDFVRQIMDELLDLIHILANVYYE